MFNKFIEKYPHYNVQDTPTEDLISKYKGSVPDEIINIWNNYGFGSFMNSFLKIVNPDEYKELLDFSYTSVYPNPIVLFITGLADLIIWENNYLIVLDYRHGLSKVLESGFEYFFEDLKDEEFIDADLLGKNFYTAKEMLGDLNFDECFGYVPLLGLGGPEKAENLEKVKLKEHISIIVQTLGKIK
ncbi:T6SS immunity protein Tdi1 domain-containing protein [Chryseobacterium caseinilyticum]|uniref:DUF1851 domain-containing protein n=1 Tax=Chryseobacterium caseinilyticum TaxID=2771428 RepID=A0ABR8ZB97_9FLAO|nr:T6SS immunity protein Tdi1 domain-containing protein [Chryseobacterium caseinilyticum]MBD8082512.1 DUF1851 domain-containing protein [Chryseobacterium caseinilyticum]